MENADTSSPEYIAARKEFVAKAAEEKLNKAENEYYATIDRETEAFFTAREERSTALAAAVDELNAGVISIDVQIEEAYN